MEFDNFWLLTPGGSPKTDKGVFYTKIDVSLTISVIVYASFGGSHKMKVNPFTLVFNLLVKIVTHNIKDKLDHMSL